MHPGQSSQPPWLVAAKRHLAQNSPAVQQLRQLAAVELRSRLAEAGRLHPGGLASIPPAERDALVLAVVDAVKNSSPMLKEPSNSHFRESEETVSIWEAAGKDVERVVIERLGIAIEAATIGNIHGDASDRAKAKVDLALRETEFGIISVLRKWPGVQSSMSGFLNVPLPRSLRSPAWSSALSDPHTAEDFSMFRKTDRITKMTATYGTAIFQIDQLSGVPGIAPHATSHSLTVPVRQTNGTSPFVPLVPQ
ncbi:hypothetical protein DFJ73DRAFT_341487 [Zopfochytrium polystomum]|nr:hypothetical protein DFJ73DRAFT_341487 [Zopfochytrium polystomum]